MTRVGDDKPPTIAGGARARARTAVTTPCPDDVELAAFVEHALSPARRLAIEDHIDGCDACRAVVGHVAVVAHAGPQKIDRYRLDRQLGEGAMGVVWQAWDPALERTIAIKVVQPELADKLGLERALREARALARLQHPNVVAVHDVGEYEHGVFIATELVDGQSLDVWQRDRAPAEVIAAYAQAARGLAAAHALGLVHRDVKPSNIFVARDGRVRVGDFGLATTSPTRPGGAADDPSASDRTPAPKLTVDGERVGTPAYMAPEQRTSPAVDARADQFSLCLALAEALLGRLPTPGEDAKALAARGVAAPWVAIARGLSARPEDRFADLAPLIAALEGAAAPSPPVPRGRRRAIGTAVITAAGAVVAVVAITTKDTSPPVLAVPAPAVALRTPAPAPAPEPWTWTATPPAIWRVTRDTQHLVIADPQHALAASDTDLAAIDLTTGKVGEPVRVVQPPAKLESLVRVGDRVLAFGRDGDVPAAWALTVAPLAATRLPFADPAPGPNLDELGAALVSPDADQILVCITNRPPAIVDATTLAILRVEPGYDCFTTLPWFTARHRVVLGSRTAGPHELDIATGALVPLTRAMRDTFAGPHGHVVTTTHDGYTIRDDRGTVLRRATGPQVDQTLTWTPDGSVLVGFTYERITLRSADGSFPDRAIDVPPSATDQIVDDHTLLTLAGVSVIAIDLPAGTQRLATGDLGLTAEVAPDHGRVLSRSDRVRVWRAGQLVSTSEPTAAFAIDPTSDDVTLLDAHAIKAWNPATGDMRLLRTLDTETPSAVIAREGGTLAYEDGLIVYRSVDGGPHQPWFEFRQDVFVQWLDLAGGLVALATPNGETYEIVDLAARTVWAIGDRKGAELLGCGSSFSLRLGPDHQIWLQTTDALVEYDRTTHARLATFGTPPPVLQTWTVIPTTGELVLAGNDDRVVIWNPHTDTAVSWPTGSNARVTSIAVDPTGAELAIGWDTGRLLWARIADLRAHATPVAVVHPADACEGATLAKVPFDAVIARVY